MRPGVFGAVALLSLSACGGGSGGDRSESSDASVVTQSSIAITDPTTTTEAVAESVAVETLDSTAAPDTEVATTAMPTTTLPSSMPAVVGMQIADARALLVQYNVRITEVPFIGREGVGTVVAQVPLAGEKFSTNVELTVSVAPPPVPDVVGLAVADARAALKELGFQVVEAEVLDEVARDGEVIGQDPPPGSQNEGTVDLKIARRPIVRLLEDLEQVARNYQGHDTYDTNGEPFPNSWLLGGGQYIEVNLSKGFREFRFTFGIEDTQKIDTVDVVRVIGDGRVLLEEQVGFRDSKSLSVDVTDVLRLRIEVDNVVSSGYSVIGTPRLLGLEGEVPEE